MTEEIQVETEETQVEPTEAENQDGAAAKSVDADKPKSDPMVGTITKLRAKLRNKDLELKDLRARVQDTSVKPKIPDLNAFMDEYGKIDHSKYSEAMDKYQDESYNYRNAQERIKQSQTQEESEAAEALKRYTKRAAQIAAEYPDFAQTVTQDIYGETLTSDLLEREKGADIAYYLGKNPAIAVGLSKMPYDQMIEAVDELEKQFKTETKKVSNAPNPLNPLEGISGKDIRNINEIDNDDEWYKARKQQKMKQFQKG